MDKVSESVVSYGLCFKVIIRIRLHCMSQVLGGRTAHISHEYVNREGWLVGPRRSRMKENTFVNTKEIVLFDKFEFICT